MNSISDEGLVAAAKELFKAKYGWQPAVHAPGDNLKAMTADIIRAYLPFHRSANQEDCRAEYEKWIASTNLTEQLAHEMWFGWQAAYQHHPAAELIIRYDGNLGAPEPNCVLNIKAVVDNGELDEKALNLAIYAARGEGRESKRSMIDAAIRAYLAALSESSGKGAV